MELDKSLSGTKTFFIGALANAIATLITYPIQVVQAKMRVSCRFFLKKSDSRIFTSIQIQYQTIHPFYLFHFFMSAEQHGGSANRRADANGELFSKNGKQDTTGMIKTIIYLVRYYGLNAQL